MQESDLDSSLDESAASAADADSLYLPTPEKVLREKVRMHATMLPSKVCFMDLTKFDEFMKQLNHIRACSATPGCNGKLIPVHVNAGKGGTITIRYACDGCVGREAVLETSSRYDPGNMSEVGMAVQVAFLIAGCTHITYFKVLKHALGINAVDGFDFQKTLRILYPVVKLMVDRMCEAANDDMRGMDQKPLGS